MLPDLLKDVIDYNHFTEECVVVVVVLFFINDMLVRRSICAISHPLVEEMI